MSLGVSKFGCLSVWMCRVVMSSRVVAVAILLAGIVAWLHAKAAPRASWEPPPPLTEQACEASGAHTERCRCSSVARTTNLTVAPSRVEHWGLPTPSCPAVPYMLKEYPTLHRRWHAEGRILIHCSRSAGLGNYMRSVPAAVLLALLLDRALVLRCDRPWKDPSTRRQVPVT